MVNSNVSDFEQNESRCNCSVIMHGKIECNEDHQ